MSDQQMYDRDAEVALLAACLWSKRARLDARHALLSSDFWVPAHEVIWNAMAALDRAGRSVDPHTLRDALAAESMRGLPDVMLEVAAMTSALPESAGEYAAIVRRWALRRRLANAGLRLHQRALSPAEVPETLATEAVTMLTGLRDTGTDVSAMPLSELMDVEDDDAPEWVIPDLLEAGDRLMLTGSEGAGKSALSRQLAVMAAAGVHPFTSAIMPPIRSLIVDCENKPAQVRRQTRPLLDWLAAHSQTQEDPTGRVLIDTPGRINITRDRDLSRLHQTIDAWQPALVVMGPIYRMSDKALQTDDEAAPFLAALDTVTARGCAVILEAHAGHSTEGVGKAQARSLRPRGSSALLGWPEFGLGLRGLGHGIADLEPWRGHREARAWPARMRRAPGNRWVETYPDDRPPPEDPQARIV